MEEKRPKLCLSIPSKPKPTTASHAAFSVPAADSGPAPLFITTFENPSQQTLAQAPPAVVIPPLPNTRRPSTTVPTDSGPIFVSDASDNSPSPSSAGYGLAVRDTEESKRTRLAAQNAAAVQRFKQDMAALPDIQGAGEYDEVPVEGFGAALLAAYGWKEGSAIGRDKTKADVKVVERGRRSGTTGLGADPLDTSDSDVAPVVRRSVHVLRYY